MPVSQTTLSPRGTRTREAILDAAIQVFAEVGEERATFSEIGRRCGRSSQAIYRYFDDKRALFETALRREDDRLQEMIDGRIAGAPFPFLTNAHRDAALALMPQFPLHERVYRSANPTDVALLLSYPAAERRRAAMAAEIRRGQAAGLLRTDVDADMLAESVHRVGIMVVVPRMLAPERRPEDVAALEYVLIAAMFAPVPDLTTAKGREAFARHMRTLTATA